MIVLQINTVIVHRNSVMRVNLRIFKNKTNISRRFLCVKI